MDAMRSALNRERLADGEFTGWVAPLERILLRKDRYLRDAPAPEPEPPPSAASPSSDAVTKPVPPSLPAHAPGHATPVPNAHVAPGQPLPPLAAEERPRGSEKRPENKPVPTTLFGEKLQAVLGLEK